VQSHRNLHAEFFWRDWLVLTSDDKVEVLDARTGRKLADLNAHEPSQ
jgi:hypothetical protein